MSLAARSAFARGDYMAVIDMAKEAEPAAIKLLLAQSYARIGADGLAANKASEAIKAILTGSDWSAAEATKGLSVLRRGHSEVGWIVSTALKASSRHV